VGSEWRGLGAHVVAEDGNLVIYLAGRIVGLVVDCSMFSFMLPPRAASMLSALALLLFGIGIFLPVLTKQVLENGILALRFGCRVVLVRSLNIIL